MTQKYLQNVKIKLRLRFVQITTIGRYGGSTTRSRIPIGCFYGHTTLLPWEVDANKEELSGGSEKAGVLSQLGTLVS